MWNNIIKVECSSDFLNAKVFVCFAVDLLYSFADLALENKSAWTNSKVRALYSCRRSGVAFPYNFEKAVIVTLSTLMLICDFIFIKI